ncbi:MAG: DNA helicase [Deltaproteobacteria bacterium SG8_13]|nr:MAG: DNA helicase [Deltaproteobacteria bacterium SG8_13]
MDFVETIKQFYTTHLPGAQLEKNFIKAPCPFCQTTDGKKAGTLVVYLIPENPFVGYFRCLSHCHPGGFPLYFSQLMGVDAEKVPGHDPDREPFVRDIVYPIKHLKADILKFTGLMSKSEYAYFQEIGISRAVVEEMKIGYNGRYLIYPYFLENGKSYAARCILPGRKIDNFWYGDEKFAKEDFRIYNTPEIDRCEGGALFLVEGEDNLLTLKELGYPGISVPSAADLEHVSVERLAYVNHVLIVTANTPEAYLSARETATRLGFKVRILKWPAYVKQGHELADLAREKGKEFRTLIAGMIQSSRSFSPFSSPDKEHRKFFQQVEESMGQATSGRRTGFPKLDNALSGVRGINIMGGPPKAGKSCFNMQVSSEMARNKIPVIYYDFENGRQKIYARTLSRLGRLSDEQIRGSSKDEDVVRRLKQVYAEFKDMLKYFRVVTDRKLNPDIMRRQIDFLQHETRTDHTVVVVDSLHKLPFKDLSDRRTGIDSWLRHMEAIRDEQNVSFFVVSELSRGLGGSYDKKPDLGSFKESGDIEYSADNAMILLPDWDPVDPISTKERKSSLWLVASRENNPGKIAVYQLEYPYWGFKEL